MSPIVTKSLSDGCGGNLLISKIFLSFSVCAVNVFILITGYFSCKTQKRNIGKPLNLIILMIAMDLASYVLQLVTGVQRFSLDGLLLHSFPVNYFVTLFVVFYILSPYINLCINKLSEKGMMRFVFILFLVYSIYPSFIDVLEEILGHQIKGISPIGRLGSQNGYNIVNFIMVYCIGAFLNYKGVKTLVEKRKYLTVVAIVVSTTFIFIWNQFSHSAVNYHNPFVILLAVSMVLAFMQIHFTSKVINELAKAAFTAFLLHVHIIHYIHIDYFSKQSPLVFILFILSSITAIYLVSWIAWWVYDKFTKPVFRRLDQIQIPYRLD